jgi:hypothetical protein
VSTEAFDYHCACGAFATGFWSREEAWLAAGLHTCRPSYPTRRSLWVGPADTRERFQLVDMEGRIREVFV